MGSLRCCEPELLIELQCIGVFLMYRRGAQVMVFYSLALDANDFLKVSEIEITDSDALLMAPMGIERTRRERH